MPGAGSNRINEFGFYTNYYTLPQALEDFYELHLDDIKKIDTDFGEGVTGILQDGTHVVVRAGSKSGGPTLEIQSLGGKIYKYRS